MSDQLAGQGQPTAELLDNGQPAQAGAVEETPAEPVSAPAVTLADVQAAINDALRGFSQQSQRTLQSQLDKRDSGLRKQIAALQTQAGVVSERAKARGIEAAQAEQLGQDFFTANLTPLLEEQPNGKGAKQRAPAPADGEDEGAEPDQQQVQAYRQTVSELGNRIANAYGLSPDDPEIRSIVPNADPETYLNSIEAAGKAKQARLARQPQGRPARSPAIGVDGGSAPRNPIANVTDTGDLYKLAFPRRT